jgi:arylsulfatase
MRADVAGDADNPDLNIAWKSLFTSKDTWMGPTQNSGGIPALYCLTMDPFEKYDMVFNGALASRLPKTSPGQYAGMDNGWCLALTQKVLGEFDKSIVNFPSIRRIAGKASTDMIPNLQNPENPLPYMDSKKAGKTIHIGD